MFLMETLFVLCDLGTNFLNTVEMNVKLQSATISWHCFCDLLHEKQIPGPNSGSMGLDDLFDHNSEMCPH
jgi:hypothetical protein